MFISAFGIDRRRTLLQNTCMAKIFFYKGKYKHGTEGWNRVTECAKDLHMDLKNLKENPVIKVTERGKPYFSDLPKDVTLHFSISNTDDLWGCAFSDIPCGFDVQGEKRGKWMEISKRKFAPEEHSYVIEKGIAGFYRLWTRKEALGKLTEEGVIKTLLDGRSLVNKNGELKKYIVVGGKRVYFHDFDYGKRKKVYCSFCSYREKEAIEIIERENKD